MSALLWDFYKWRYAERVQLRVWASAGFVTTNNPHENLIRISVTNIGKIPTTINLLSLHGFDTKGELRKRNGKNVAIIHRPLFSPLPAKLDPGNEWSGCINQDTKEIYEYLKFKYFIIQVEDTMSKRPFRAEVDKSRIKADLRSNRGEYEEK